MIRIFTKKKWNHIRYWKQRFIIILIITLWLLFSFSQSICSLHIYLTNILFDRITEKLKKNVKEWEKKGIKIIRSVGQINGSSWLESIPSLHRRWKKTRKKKWRESEKNRRYGWNGITQHLSNFSIETFHTNTNVFFSLSSIWQWILRLKKSESSINRNEISFNRMEIKIEINLKHSNSQTTVKSSLF